MKPTRDEVVEMIERQANTPTPPVDPAFVERLERRLRSLDLTPTTGGRRRIGRFTVTVVVAGTLLAGAAAAAGVVTLRRSAEPAATTNVAEPPTTEEAATTTTSLIAVPTTAAVVNTAAVPLVSAATTATAPREPPTTAEPTTQPPASATTVPATSSTEVRVAPTLTLSCTPAGAAIACSWDPGPDSTTHYALLRTDPTTTNGRVFTPEAGATAYTDTLVVPGTTYTYLVHALDSAEHSVAHSDHVIVSCCG